MNSVEAAVEAAAKAWHDRTENEEYRNAVKELESGSGEYWADTRAYEQWRADCKEAVELGPISWEDIGEWGQEYSRSQVRQTVLDALPAYLYAESKRADESAVEGQPSFKYLCVIAGYLEGLAQDV